jgi:hypothetical protein
MNVDPVRETRMADLRKREAFPRSLSARHRPAEQADQPASVDSSDPVVILVHGTFAGDARNSGDKWWQFGSRAANHLQTRLPAGVNIASDSDVFHWSGENSERARNKAAIDLLAHMERQEQAGRDYHLVGHSHGGSVIWNALRMATLRRRDLVHLKSWTTVGTPYLQHRGRRALDPMNMISMFAGMLLLPMAFRALMTLTTMVGHALTGNNVIMKLAPDADIGYIAIIRSPIFAALNWIGVSVRNLPDGVYIGKYDPTKGQSLVDYFFTTPEGLLLLGVTMFVIYAFLHLSMLCIRPALESYRLRAEERLQLRTFEVYGLRSLSLWSPDDEAINGLRTTLEISINFVRKMIPQERVFLSDVVSCLSLPYFWIFSPIYNRWVQPRLDSVVRRMVIRSAQGNDRPAATIFAVTPSPVQELRDCAPSLPERLNQRIVSVADHHARDIAPMLRSLLATASFASGFEAFCRELSGKELVHTSYFDHPEVLDLIACNIALETDIERMQRQLGRMSPYLVEWFADVKKRLQHESSIDIVAARHLPLRRAA